MKKFIIVLVAGIVLLLAGVGGSAFFVFQKFSNAKASEVSNEVIYEVKNGTSFNSLAQDLVEKGVVTNAKFFSWYARILGERNKVKSGEYLLKTDMLPKEVLSVITSGKSIERSFTVSEGLNLYDIAEIFEKNQLSTKESFWQLTHDKVFIKSLIGEEQSSLEGYLFPETYKYTKFMDTKAIVTMMVKRFLAVYAEVAPQAEVQGFSRHQIVTLASIVEKETGAPVERPLISSIFHNRLQKNMRLQTDPTVLYGKAELNGKMEISITRQDLLTPNPYNTYTIPALPPGPISNPGKDALLAAVKPAKSNYLYFVSQNNGTHVFSEDYKGHLKAVQKFQLDPKAREGKSWRDLKDSKTNETKR